MKKENNYEQDHRSALVNDDHRILLVGDTRSSRENITESIQITDEGLELTVCEVAVDDDNLAVIITHTYSSFELRELQMADPDVKFLLQWIESKKSLTQAELQLSSPAVKYFWINKPLLEAKDGVLFYRWVDEVKESQLLIIPHSLKKEVLHRCHDLKLSGHPGMTWTFSVCVRTTSGIG